ncbi:beta-sandwich domain-containing protein [Parabacteroides sp.]
MKKLMRTGACLLLMVSMTLGFAGCKKDDPDYENVNPPVVAAAHSISGRVTSMSGEGIIATVTMEGSESKTTGEDGTFLFENVKSGTYTLKAEASGKVSKEGSVTVSSSEKSENQVWNVTLSNAGTEVTAKEDGSAEAVVSSETIKGNEEGKVEINVSAPVGAVPAGSLITITPTYSLEDASSLTKAGGNDLRATESVVLVGTNVSCSDASVTLREPLNLVYNVDPDVATALTAQKYVNGQWVNVDYTVDGDKVTVIADSFTSYTLLLGAEVSSSSSSETISFGQDSWDNLYGSGNMSVSSASYAYKIGTEIGSFGTNRITAYLVEILARIAGAGVTTATGSYPINVTLPVGTAMSISGEQEVTSLSVSALGRSVSGKQYGTVAVVTRTWNRQHTGGGSKD